MRILIVEDEFLVATALEDALQDMGHEVIGPVATIAAALAALEEGAAPDAAIVDLNLRGCSSAPVASELQRLDIPFLFATGYEIDAALQRRFPAALWLQKPYTGPQIRGMFGDMGLPTGDSASEPTT